MAEAGFNTRKCSTGVGLKTSRPANGESSIKLSNESIARIYVCNFKVSRIVTVEIIIGSRR